MDPLDIATQIDVAFRPTVRGGWRQALALSMALEDIASLRIPEFGQHGNGRLVLLCAQLPDYVRSIVAGNHAYEGVS